MTTFDFGDVVLVPFPYTDLSTSKKRPAVVVSSQAYQRERADIIVMPVTGQVRARPIIGDVLIGKWQEANLIKPSAIKPIIASLEERLVIRKLGRLREADQEALRGTLAKMIG